MNSKCDLLTAISVYYAADYEETRFALQLDTEFIVYAIWIRGPEILYSILDDERVNYPKWFPSVLGQVIDGRMPSC